MEILLKALQLIFSLSILIILHELGHFIAARWFGMRVEKFYLFFNPWFSLFRFKRGETEYGIGWLPLGGYVKIAGMIDESMDKKQLSRPPQPWEFRSKPAWQRLIVMIGGVTVNLLLAVFIYAMLLFSFGEKYLPTESLKDGIWCIDSLATELGFRNGDKIISVDGKKVENFQDILHEMLYAQTVQVERNGETTNLYLPKNFVEKLVENKRIGVLIFPRVPHYVKGFPEHSNAKQAGLMPGDQIIGLNDTVITYFDEFISRIPAYKGQIVNIKIKRKENEIKEFAVPVDSNGKIGVESMIPDFRSLYEAGIYEFKVFHYGFLEAFPAGIHKAITKLRDYVRQFKLIFDFETGAYKGVGSFLTIGDLFPSKWDWEIFWELTAILSIVLAFLNILPIPALDGGHVMFVLYEIITRKQPSERFLEYAQYAGMFLLIALMAFALGNDIIRFSK